MNVDVVNILCRHSGIVEGIAHDVARTEAVGVRSRQVVGVGRKASARKFCIDFCSSCFGVLVLFKYKGRPALAQYKAVAVLVKRPGCREVVVVARRKSVHGVESAYSAHRNSGLRTACDNDVSLAQANEHECVDNGVGRRGAGRNRSVVWSAVSVLHGDVAATDVGNHFGNEEWIEARIFAVFKVFAVLFGKGVHAADPRAPNNANAVFVGIGIFEARISDCLLCGNQTKMGEAVHAAHFFALDEVFYIKALHLAGKLRFKLGCVKMSNRPSTTASLK